MGWRRNAPSIRRRVPDEGELGDQTITPRRHCIKTLRLLVESSETVPGKNGDSHQIVRVRDGVTAFPHRIEEGARRTRQNEFPRILGVQGRPGNRHAEALTYDLQGIDL